MDRRKKVFCGAAGMIVFLLSVTACTGSTQEPLVSNNPGPTMVSSAEPQPTPIFTPPSTLPAATDVGQGEKLLFQKSSQKLSATYGPVATEAKTIVYLRCAGDGTVKFELKGVGAYPMPCEESADTHGTRNVFDTRYVKNPTFSVDSLPGQIWSVGIYSEPVP
ncbi:hypothetical protein [Specibacter sp. RAF43]|uniref:hypothetical protein n=1 Tax=Specibacter sp. RAF43 TaxID=3233057 RepID=UPI003F94AC03